MNQHAPLKPIDVDAHRFGMSPLAWVGMVAVGGGYIAMHWEILRRSVSFSKDPNWSHILIVPLIAAYYIGQHKKRIAGSSSADFLASATVGPGGVVRLYFLDLSGAEQYVPRL